MATWYTELDEDLTDFIGRQKIFFVATAAAGTRINLSPKEGSALRVLDANTVVYLDKTGSGNETAAHVKGDGRITIMMCAVEGPPQILRLYGQGKVLHRDSQRFGELLRDRYDGEAPPGVRQMIQLDLEHAQTSCGFGVPMFDFVEERRVLDRWATGKKPAGIEKYWREKNVASIDGLPTGIFEDAAE